MTAGIKTLRVASNAPLDEVFLTEQQLAARHQRSVKTLRNDRVLGGYIKFVRIGRTIRYRLSDVVAYENENSFRSTSEAEMQSR
jgi:hypothetical protein